MIESGALHIAQSFSSPDRDGTKQSKALNIEENMSNSGNPVQNKNRAVDKYALGMSHYDESEYETTLIYDYYQFSFISAYLGKRILEVGAGTGRISQLVLEKHQYIQQIPA